MLVRLLLAALICAPAVAHADDKGEIDWSRRVIKARGQGAPDLSAPSISVARLGAERAAKADAMRNLLELLKGATVTGGGQVNTLLQNDAALRTQVTGALRGFRVAPGLPGHPNPHYYSDGGVAIDVELPIDSLPEELRKGLKAPAGYAPAGEAKAEGAAFVIDALGLGSPEGDPRLADAAGERLSVEVMGVIHSMDGKPTAVASAPELRARKIRGADVVISDQDAARVRAAISAGGARVLFVY